MPGPTFPYKIRIGLPASYGIALARLSARDHKAITALIRDFVGDGLRTSGIDMSPEPVKGQTAIDDSQGDA